MYSREYESFIFLSEWRNIFWLQQPPCTLKISNHSKEKIQQQDLLQITKLCTYDDDMRVFKRKKTQYKSINFYPWAYKNSLARKKKLGIKKEKVLFRWVGRYIKSHYSRTSHQIKFILTDSIEFCIFFPSSICFSYSLFYMTLIFKSIIIVSTSPSLIKKAENTFSMVLFAQHVGKKCKKLQLMWITIPTFFGCRIFSFFYFDHTRAIFYSSLCTWKLCKVNWSYR